MKIDDEKLTILDWKILRIKKNGLRIRIKHELIIKIFEMSISARSFLKRNKVLSINILYFIYFLVGILHSELNK